MMIKSSSVASVVGEDTELARLYCSGLSAPPVLAEVAAWLAECLPRARAACPGVSLPDAALVEHLARHHRADAWPKIEIGDLLLARACAAADPVALALLESRCFSDVTKAVLQVGVGAADCDEVMQSVRELLLVGVAPHILRYAGRGPLRAWVRSIAVRTAIKHLRSEARQVPVDEEVFLEFAAAADNPELEPFKQRYREQFRAAFSDALARLPVRQRNLLRHYFLDGMSIDEIGALYRVHRATAARWVNDLREEFQAAVRAALEGRVALQGSDLGSLLDLVRSQLELSLDRLLPSD
jgi:RNA polymerase sigma-70 factor, ECF subfamily